MILHEAMDQKNTGKEFPAEMPALMPLDGFETVPGAEDYPLPFFIFGDEDEEEDIEEDDGFGDAEEDFGDEDDEFEDDDFDDDDEDEDDDYEDEDDDYDYEEDADYNDFDE